MGTLNLVDKPRPRMSLPMFRHPWSSAAALALLMLTGAGCRALRTTAELPGQALNTITPGRKANSAFDPVDLQLQLQRFADEFGARTGQALDEYARRVGTESARVETLRLKLLGGSSVISIASDPNPNVSLLDLVSVTVLTRMSIEDYWMNTTNGPAFQPWLEVSRALETNVWQLAASMLKPAQVDELRAGIGEWRARNPETRNAFFARPHQLAKMVKPSPENRAGLDSVFNLVNLDPMAGLDPAVREVTRTRLFAERAMFTAQRMPFLLRLQTELLAYDLARQPEVQRALTNMTRLSDSADRISRAAESVGQTAAQVPDRLTAERKAILDALETQEGRLRELSAEISRALTAGETMSASLNTTLITFDALMKRLGVGEPNTHSAADTHSTPFNILDYARTADQLALMAKALDVLIQDAGSTLDSPALNQRLQDVSAVADRAKADAKSVLNHAFLLGASLVLLTFACALGYRRLVPRGIHAPARPG
jgi:hypothetical protein